MCVCVCMCVRVCVAQYKSDADIITCGLLSHPNTHALYSQGLHHPESMCDLPVLPLSPCLSTPCLSLHASLSMSFSPCLSLHVSLSMPLSPCLSLHVSLFLLFPQPDAESNLWHRNASLSSQKGFLNQAPCPHGDTSGRRSFRRSGGKGG